MFVGAQDKNCPATSALEMSKRLSTLDNYVTVEGEKADHYIFRSSINKSLVRALKQEMESDHGSHGPKTSTVDLDKEEVEPVHQGHHHDQDSDMMTMWDMLHDSSMAAPAATLTGLFAAAMLQ